MTTFYITKRRKVVKMVDLIKQMEEIGWENIIISFSLIICVIVTAVSGYKKLLSTLGLRSEKSIQEAQLKDNMDSMQKQIDDLNKKVNDYQTSIIKKQEEYHQQSITIRDNLNKNQMDLKTDIQTLKDMLQEFIKEQNQSTVAILRSSLWRLHKEFVTQGFITPDGLKTFMEMGKVYESAGGDDIYHEKLLPEIEELSIHYPDGSIYNQRN